VLVLFPNAWDVGELRRDKYAGRCEFVFEGGDLFKLPGALRLLRFDPPAMIARLARKYRGAGLAGVMSSDEYVGAAMAAALARELGLPHADPGHIVTAQHKVASRRLQKQTVPEAVPDFAVVRLATGTPDPPLPYPFFVKPVKGTFSLFAKKVADEKELRAHLDFKLWERFALGRVTAPFDALVRAYTDIDVESGAFIAESLIEGAQVTVDGFACDGEVTPAGIVDSVMFPGTSTFERFDYPSRLLPAPVQARMMDIATRLVKGLGIRQAQFNIEFFWDEKRDRVWVIEINPRMSYQFADLYENVDGTSSYDVLLDLTLGERPRFERRAGRYKVASSFVLRTFRGKRLVSVPSEADVDRFAKQYDDARLRIYGRAGSSLRGEMRAMGSYRYGIVNVGTSSLLDLFAVYNDVLEKLPFRFE
jgi:biotin carboxylase